MVNEVEASDPPQHDLPKLPVAGYYGSHIPICIQVVLRGYMLAAHITLVTVKILSSEHWKILQKWPGIEYVRIGKNTEFMISKMNSDGMRSITDDCFPL